MRLLSRWILQMDSAQMLTTLDGIIDSNSISNSDLNSSSISNADDNSNSNADSLAAVVTNQGKKEPKLTPAERRIEALRYRRQLLREVAHQQEAEIDQLLELGYKVRNLLFQAHPLGSQTNTYE